MQTEQKRLIAELVAFAVAPYFLGGIAGAGHAGCFGFGQGGLCQAPD